MIREQRVDEQYLTSEMLSNALRDNKQENLFTTETRGHRDFKKFFSVFPCLSGYFFGVLSELGD